MRYVKWSHATEQPRTQAWVQGQQLMQPNLVKTTVSVLLYGVAMSCNIGGAVNGGGGTVIIVATMTKK